MEKFIFNSLRSFQRFEIIELDRYIFQNLLNYQEADIQSLFQTREERRQVDNRSKRNKSLKFEETPRTVSPSRLVGAEEEECREELSPARIRKCPITFVAARRFFSFHVSGRSIVTTVARLLFGTYRPSIDPTGILIFR